MFTYTFTKRFILILLLVAALVACTDSFEPDVQVGQTMTKLSPITITAVPTAAPFTFGAWSDYQNEFYAYKVSYPTEAQIKTRGVDFVSSELVPANMTDDEYLAQLNSTYPDNIYLTILYQQGFVTILAPRDNGGQFIGICGLGGIGVYEFLEKEEELIIDGQSYMASGSELREQNSEQTFHGGFFILTLADGTMITYGTADLLATASAQWEALAFEDYLVLIETLQQIVTSYRSIGTPTTPTPAPSPLSGTAWQLETVVLIEGESATAQPVPEGILLTAVFETGQVTGETGCNYYGFRYQIDGSRLTFPEGELTAAGCVDEQHTTLESQFMAGMQSAESYTLDGNRLTIAFPRGEFIFGPHESD